ncbi:hypothetical protein DFH06DRAFT_522083 [Mycena polygramma]|nr:hypothetical protein DFH06DRAFT_522083 [Mycena polygramma]
MIPRHFEVMVFPPREAHQLKSIASLAAADLLVAAEQLFGAILDAFRHRILHRDISVNNVLIADGQLLLVDWDIGRKFDAQAPAAGNGTCTVAGTSTLDTMSVARLKNWDLLPHDAVESAVYVLLKVLTQNFVPPPELQREWTRIRRGFLWDDPAADPSMLANFRATLWSQVKIKGTTVRETVELFRASGHETHAQLVVALLDLPLPEQRDGPLDYDAVLLSIEDLVRKAIAASRSVDASSLDGS